MAISVDVHREAIIIQMAKTLNLALALALTSLLALVMVNHEVKPYSMNFNEFKRSFGVFFDSTFEEKYRERVYAENIAKIEAHNANKARSFDMGINQFSHLTEEEFAETYLGTIVPTSNVAVDETMISVGDVDWVSSGAVTAVKNQGQCGSCWAFSATGALEGLSKLGFGNLQSFSEQQLVDCSASYGNNACNGGLMDRAFKFVKEHGITTEAAYPYKAVKGNCVTNSGAFKISGFTDVSGCANLATALTGRPLSVAVDATNWSPYKSGVFNNCKTSLNHGVLLVGVTDQYWKVKNSWSTTWGESGFIRLAKGNTCGLCNQPSYPNK